MDADNRFNLFIAYYGSRERGSEATAERVYDQLNGSVLFRDFEIAAYFHPRTNPHGSFEDTPMIAARTPLFLLVVDSGIPVNFAGQLEQQRSDGTYRNLFEEVQSFHNSPMYRQRGVSLAQIDEMREEMAACNNDNYTPILVFMTDGTPTDNPREEIASVRRRVRDGELYVFPLGIGAGADMTLLRDMFPEGHIPSQFTTRYKMIEPRQYQTIFQEIREHVQRKFSVMVSEGDSVQSAPATEEKGVISNQTGMSIMDMFEQGGFI